MLLRLCFLQAFLVLTLVVAGCAEPKVSNAPDATSMTVPVRVKSADLVVVLLKIAEHSDKGTLIEDHGWREYVIEIENISTDDVTVRNVKLLNQQGRYLDSASAYAQITAPPDVGVELAGDVAERAAGMAAGQVVPYGGTIVRVLSNAASVSSAGADANAKRAFMLRVLKNVELAPTGMVEGGAFLPNITSPKALVVDYARDGTMNRIQIPLSVQEP